MGEVERIARLIANALHVEGADVRVAMEVHKLWPSGVFAIPREMNTTPLWRLYEPAARVIVDDIERKMEAKG